MAVLSRYEYGWGMRMGNYILGEQSRCLTFPKNEAFVFFSFKGEVGADEVRALAWELASCWSSFCFSIWALMSSSPLLARWDPRRLPVPVPRGAAAAASDSGPISVAACWSPLRYLESRSSYSSLRDRRSRSLGKPNLVHGVPKLYPMV